MLRKKVVIKSKKTPEISQHQRSTSNPGPAPQGKGKARVYSLTTPASLPKNTTYIINNMVKLRININDIERLEQQLLNHNNGLLAGIDKPFVPTAWNSSSNSSSSSNSMSMNAPTGDTQIHKRKKDPFKSLIKRTSTKITTGENSASIPIPNRKDLIINSGINRQSHPILQVYSHGWPAHSSYACWYCCHSFNTTPVGIPQLLVNMVFHCYGNFCSYNCAKRYLRPESEDDVAMLQTCNDSFIKDDLGERMQLLELLCHIETGAPLDTPIKPAPRRLTLSMFGGDKSIEEFRKNFHNNDNYHVFRAPLVPISYQMEEATDKIERKRRQRVSIDTVKIERAFSELAENAKKTKGGLSKRRTLKA